MYIPKLFVAVRLRTGTLRFTFSLSGDSSHLPEAFGEARRLGPPHVRFKIRRHQLQMAMLT